MPDSTPYTDAVKSIYGEGWTRLKMNEGLADNQLEGVAYKRYIDDMCKVSPLAGTCSMSELKDVRMAYIEADTPLWLETAKEIGKMNGVTAVLFNLNYDPFGELLRPVFEYAGNEGRVYTFIVETGYIREDDDEYYDEDDE